MVILKATSFLEGHNKNMGMTCRITLYIYMKKRKKKKKNRVVLQKWVGETSSSSIYKNDMFFNSRDKVERNFIKKNMCISYAIKKVYVSRMLKDC